MKKLLIMGILFLLLVPSACAEEQTLFPALDRSCLALPLVPVPGTLSPDPLLVRQCQVLASGYDAEDEASLFEAAGMQVLLQQGYDKPLTDPAHTCAFTIGYGTGDTPVCLIVIRGTRGAEWYANMDVAPSRNMDTVFAENFLYAASDVFQALDRLPAFPENTIYLVTGHSRGAACANLLALLLNERFGPEHVLGLTFATPATLRSRDLAAADNIWNYLNPEDAVPMLPLSSWGFCRAGHDILLPGDGGPAASLLDTLTALAPSLESYYSVRHSLTGPGVSDDGISAYEIMLLFADALSGESLPSGQSMAESGGLSGLTGSGSDLEPLLLRMQELSARQGEGFSELLEQHLPNTYLSKLDALFAEGGEAHETKNPAGAPQHP